ncbi:MULTISPECIES: ZIP family metal transporter [Salinibaculum]|uniref:ZIP family metal transporter n=1 Tax=Salinibaculum TaxID=2732368 RepID=UPI0030D44C0E
MPNIDTTDASVERPGPTRHRVATGLGLAAVLVFVAALGGGLLYGRTKLVGIVLFAFVAMVAGVGIQQYSVLDTPLRRLWAYGLTSGAMLASAAALLAPKAILQHPEYGGFAIAFGYLSGYAGHELGHHLSHRSLPVNGTVAELTVHAMLAGSIMGVVYGTLPSLTPLFGYGIVAHKLPAGFSGAETLDRDDLPLVVMALPAAAVGLVAIPLSISTPALGSVIKALFYGVSTGVFAHVAIDMIPECSGGGSGHGHGEVACGPQPDTQRRHAVFSTLSGAGALFVVWQVLAAI